MKNGAAFGWYVQRVDGNDLAAVVAAFDNAKNHAGNQPPGHFMRHADGQRGAIP